MASYFKLFLLCSIALMEAAESNNVEALMRIDITQRHSWTSRLGVHSKYCTKEERKARVDSTILRNNSDGKRRIHHAEVVA